MKKPKEHAETKCGGSHAELSRKTSEKTSKREVKTTCREAVEIKSTQRQKKEPGQGKGCRNDLAVRYIDHMPFIQNGDSRLAVWSDVKEVLFPSCSDPACDIVLNALKVVSRYPWEKVTMYPCSPMQQVIFLRHFRLVHSGTLLVDLKFVKDNIDDLWEMVRLKHSNSSDDHSRQCHYSLMQRTCNSLKDSSGDPDTSYTDTDAKTGTDVDTSEDTDTRGNTNNIMDKNSCVSTENKHTNSTTSSDKQMGKIDDNLHTGSQSRTTSQQTKHSSENDCQLQTYPTIETLKIMLRPADDKHLKDTVPSAAVKRQGYGVLPVLKSSDVQSFASVAEISVTFPQLRDYLIKLSGEFVVGHKDSKVLDIRRCTYIEGRCFTSWKMRRHGWNKQWQHMTTRDLIISWEAVMTELRNLARTQAKDNVSIPLSDFSSVTIKKQFHDIFDDVCNTTALPFSHNLYGTLNIMYTDSPTYRRNRPFVVNDHGTIGSPVSVPNSTRRCPPVCTPSMVNSMIQFHVQTPSVQAERQTTKSASAKTGTPELTQLVGHTIDETLWKSISSCVETSGSCLQTTENQVHSEVTNSVTLKQLCQATLYTPPFSSAATGPHKEHGTTALIPKGKTQPHVNLILTPVVKEGISATGIIPPCENGEAASSKEKANVGEKCVTVLQPDDVIRTKGGNVPLQAESDNEAINASNLLVNNSDTFHKQENAMKHPKKRQRVKSPSDSVALKYPEITKEDQILLNTNHNASDEVSSDHASSGPSLSELVSYRLPKERGTTGHYITSLQAVYGSSNQNALLPNLISKPQTANVSFHRVPQSDNNGGRLEPTIHSSTGRPAGHSSVRPLGPTSTYNETFHHLNKFITYPDDATGRSCLPTGISNRATMTTKPDHTMPLKSSSQSLKLDKGVPTGIAVGPSKSQPQWNIDQVLQGHPRGLKGDSLYGISIRKAQAQHPLHKVSAVARVPSRNIPIKQPYTDALQRQELNEALPYCIKQKSLTMQKPSKISDQMDKTKQKSIWYRNESLSSSSQGKRRYEQHLLEMVSASPFTQTVESLKAIRKLNTDFDHVSVKETPNRLIDTRPSPLPNIATNRKETQQPTMVRRYESSKRIRDPCDSSAKKTNSVNECAQKTSDTTNFTSLKDTNICIIKKSPCVNENRVHQNRPNIIKKQVAILTRKTSEKLPEDQKENIDTLSQEQPRLSKSENCVKSKSSITTDKTVYRSASSPALPIHKYKVKMRDLTLTFTRLKGGKKTLKEERQSKQKHTSKESQLEPTEEEVDTRDELKQTLNQVDESEAGSGETPNRKLSLNKSKEKSAKSEHRQRQNSSIRKEKVKHVQCFARAIGSDIEKERSKFTNTPQNYEILQQTNSTASPSLGKEQTAKMCRESKKQMHTKKRWMLEYQQNVNKGLDDLDEEASAVTNVNCEAISRTRPVVKSSTITTMCCKDTNGSDPVDESSMTTVECLGTNGGELVAGVYQEDETRETDNQTLIFESDGDVEEGENATLVTALDVEDSDDLSLSDGNHDIIGDPSVVVSSVSRDTTYSEMTESSKSSSSDGGLHLDDNECGLVEEIVEDNAFDAQNIETSCDIFLEVEINSETKVRNKEQVVEKHTSDNSKANFASDVCCEYDDCDDPFEGSVYVLDDESKGISRGSLSSLQVLRRSVRQHISPRKSMADIPDNSIYNDNFDKERTTSESKRTKKQGKKKSVSKAARNSCSSKTLRKYDDERIEEKEYRYSSSSASSKSDQAFIQCKKEPEDDTTINTPDTCVMPALQTFHTECKETYSGRGRTSPDIGHTVSTTPKREDANNYSQKRIWNDLKTIPPTHSRHRKAKQQLTKQNMTTANAAIVHLAAEQRRMMDIIHRSSSWRSLPPTSSSTSQTVQRKSKGSPRTETPNTDYPSLSFVPVCAKDGSCQGGYVHMEGVTCPYVLMNGYKFVAIQDVVRMFSECDRKCKVVRNVLTKYRGLFRTYCDWDQVYFLDQLYSLKGRTVKTGDMLLRVDSLAKHMSTIRDQVRESHLHHRHVKGKGSPCRAYLMDGL